MRLQCCLLPSCPSAPPTALLPSPPCPSVLTHCLLFNLGIVCCVSTTGSCLVESICARDTCRHSITQMNATKLNTIVGQILLFLNGTTRKSKKSVHIRPGCVLSESSLQIWVGLISPPWLEEQHRHVPSYSPEVGGALQRIR